jgi:protein phosphatase 1 regulatory subunit 11
MTITPTPASDAGPSTANNPRSPPVGVLKLRGGPRRQRVMWTDETVDNEGMGRKKSKSTSKIDVKR